MFNFISKLCKLNVVANFVQLILQIEKKSILVKPPLLNSLLAQLHYNIDLLSAVLLRLYGIF